MKKYLRSFLLVVLCCYSISTMYSQPIKAPMFGKDIVISNIPNQNQRNLAVCSAFNGWLFAVYSYATPQEGKCSIYKSTDGGINWTLAADGGLTGSPMWEITKLDIIACGNSLSTLKIFLVYAFYDTTTVSKYMCYGVNRFNGEPFYVEAVVFSDNSIRKHDIAIGNDYPFAALNSNPNSLSVLYSKTGISDSIICFTSSDGGMTFDNKEIVSVSDSHTGGVDICYGRSTSASSGRYYAVWEEKEDEYATLGHIYTSHSEPFFNSGFTTPACLDSLIPSGINKCRRPSIACQSSNYDNTSSDLTEMVFFEKTDEVSNNNEIRGFYNLHATTANIFTETSITNSLDNNMQPSAVFNPFDSTFYLTYFDSTQQKLPLLSMNVNVPNPDIWNIITSGYNDEPNLESPFPSVAVDFQTLTPINAWTSSETNSNGIAFFDAFSSTYTGLSQNPPEGVLNNLRIFPNPCSELVIISFETEDSSEISIDVINMFGQVIIQIPSQKYNAGNHEVKLDVSELSAGCYVVKCISTGFKISFATLIHR